LFSNFNHVSCFFGRAIFAATEMLLVFRGIQHGYKNETLLFFIGIGTTCLWSEKLHIFIGIPTYNMPLKWNTTFSLVCNMPLKWKSYTFLSAYIHAFKMKHYFFIGIGTTCLWSEKLHFLFGICTTYLWREMLANFCRKFFRNCFKGIQSAVES
jgi:hypothetical protein